MGHRPGRFDAFERQRDCRRFGLANEDRKHAPFVLLFLQQHNGRVAWHLDTHAAELDRNHTVTLAGHPIRPRRATDSKSSLATSARPNVDEMVAKMLDPKISRVMWEAVERFHALCYTSPEVREEGTAAGLKGFWMNYFATRIAPVGAVGPGVVQSTFFYYAPSRVERAIPDAWAFSDPERIIDARYRGMHRSLVATYADLTTSPQMAEAAALAREAVEGCEPMGRLLYAGWASLDWPVEPHLALWHACTLLREHRSGSHLIAICAEGLSGCESVVSHAAVGGAPRDWIQGEAAWTATDETAAAASLCERGWLDVTGTITDEGRKGRNRIEAMTNQLDLPIWNRLGPAKGQRLYDLLADLVSVLPPDDQLDWREHYPTGTH